MTPDEKIQLLQEALRHIALDDCDLCDARICPTASDALAATEPAHNCDWRCQASCPDWQAEPTPPTGEAPKKHKPFISQSMIELASDGARPKPTEGPPCGGSHCRWNWGLGCWSHHAQSLSTCSELSREPTDAAKCAECYRPKWKCICNAAKCEHEKEFLVAGPDPYTYEGYWECSACGHRTPRHNPGSTSTPEGETDHE